MCEKTGGFQRRYHMTSGSFEKLTSMLSDDLQIDTAKSRSSTMGQQPIIPEVIVAAGLRFLGGEATKSFADIFGMSIDSGRRVVQKNLNAVNKNDELSISLPTTTEEFEKLAAKFTSVSSANGIYQ
jgi:hypothetical protein